MSDFVTKPLSRERLVSVCKFALSFSWNICSRCFLSHYQTVVIGLQSTGESRMKDIVEKESDELDDFVSTAK